MSGLSFGDFASRVRRAEADLAAGRWRAAFDVYASTLRQRIGDLSWEADALTDADFVALERLADIAVPLGETDVADALYTVAAGRPGGGDPQTRVRATVKRVQIALGADRFAEALRHASSLERDLGSLRAIECTDPGLVRWASARVAYWPRSSAISARPTRRTSRPGSYWCRVSSTCRRGSGATPNPVAMARRKYSLRSVCPPMSSWPGGSKALLSSSSTFLPTCCEQ